MDGSGKQPQGMRVLVLGGTGFIGHHAVAALLERGCSVTIGSRFAMPGHRHQHAGCGWRQTRFETLLEPRRWLPVLDDIDVVINSVGILRQRGAETYDRVHHLAPAALALACRQRQVRLLHVTALGLQPSARSRFLKSKLAGEQAVRRSGADWRLVRPSLLDGEGGYGAKWIRRVARWPLHLLPANASGKIAALDVAELGEALATLALHAIAADAEVSQREFELGGPDQQSILELLAAIRRRHTARPALALRIPAMLARLGSHACDLLHVTPYSYGHYELLRNDNCPRHNRLPELLGRMPKAVGPPGLPTGSALPQPLPAS